MQEKHKQADQTQFGAERRRFPRLPMFKKATLCGGELDGKRCIIRDFCPGGMFLSWPDNSTGESIKTIADRLPGKNFSVEFNVKHKNSDDKSYFIGFNVVRVFQGGMGVSFVDPDQSVIDVLIKIAEATQKKQQARSKQNNIPDSSKDQDTYYNKSLLGQLNLDRNLDEILRLFFKKLDNRFLVLFRETSDESEKFEYFNAREIFKNDLEIPKNDILQAVTAQLDGKNSLKWEKSLNEEIDGNSLTLVDEKEFEAYLLLTGIISDAEADNRLLIFRVTKKLSELYKTEFDEGLNPIGFSRLCRTIDHYLQHRNFSYTALKIAYRLMGEVLIPELVVLYEELSEGVEATPVTNATNQFDHDSDANGSTGLDEQVVDNEQHQSGVHLNNNFNSNRLPNYGARSFTQNTGQFQPQPVFQSGNNNTFPSLDGYVPSSITKSAGGLNQTLMALKKSSGVPDTLHNVFHGSEGQGNDIHTDRGSTFPGFSGVTGNGSSGGMPGISIPENQQQSILQFLDKIREEDIHNWQNGETISDVTGRLSPMLYGAQQQLTDDAQNALNLAGGVLDFLKDDQYLSEPARQNLKRMQTVLYKQAVSHGGLFQERSNPLRTIINLLEQLDMRGGNNQPETQKVVDEMIGKILSLEDYDTGNLSNITNSLNDLLDQQVSTYEKRVQKLVEQCDLEQTMLKDFRKENNQDPAVQRAQQVTPSGEYKVWQDRARAMNRGDSVVVDDGHGGKKHLSLAWVGPDSSQFVFVDGEGNKAANMTQQELVVRLLKGTAEMTDENQKPLFDRAIISSLFNAYDDVKEQILNDPETGLLTEEKFLTELNLILENAIRDHVEHAFFHVELSEDSSTESDKINAYIKHIAEQANTVIGEQVLIGRLGKNRLGIASEFMSREGALIAAETLLKSLEDNTCQLEDTNLNFPVAVGISIIYDSLCDTSEVITQGARATEKAWEQGNNQTWLYEGDDPVDKVSHDSIDWQFWLEDYSQSDEIIPLYGQKILLTGDDQAKPLLHIFSADEDQEENLRTPARFIKSSSESNLITDFEKKFIQMSLQWMSENKKQIRSFSRCLISLSSHAINNKGMLDFVIEQLTENTVPPGKICFEIPGSPPEGQKANINRFIRTLSEFGCQFSLGQFGSGGLSQDTLKLPAQYICIDEVLTSDVVESAQSYGLIKSINDIAHMMDKQTIVPQSVHDDTLEMLYEMNIDYISHAETEKPERLNSVPAEDL